MSNESENKMSNERIDLEHLEEDALLQDLNWSIARFEGIETLVKEMLAELKRCYEELDKWTYYATYIENVDMDCHKDASAEAGFLWKCTDCGAHFELPENGIYECEFGCDASE